jgi:type I restriction enzyme S subunit
MQAKAPQAWREVCLEEVCDRITVGHVGPMAKDYVPDGIPFLRSQNIAPFHIDLNDVKYITSEFHQKLKKSALSPGDVAIVRTGHPGTAAVVPASLPVANCADLVIIRPSQEIDPWFLTCLFNSVWGKRTVAGNLVGVAQQHFNVGAAKNLRIYLPPIEIQRRIAAILSAYDDLIENNTRRIVILEEMARRLYEEWFVHFRFPGHEGVKIVESEIGAVPEGWTVKTVQDAFEILGGGTPSKQVDEYWQGGDISWYTPTDLTKSGDIFMDRSGMQITELGLKKSSARLFPPFSVMMTSRATLGVIAINTTEASTNQGFITCLPNDEVPLYTLYHWLKANVEQFISLGTGATFKEITKGVFKTVQLAVPTSEIVQEFESKVGPMMVLVLRLQRKNMNLRAQRDLLLPKLISGGIDVSEIGGPIAEVAAE